MLLHRPSYSPDPLYDRLGLSGRNGNQTTLKAYPLKLTRSWPTKAPASKWAQQLDFYTDPGKLVIKTSAEARFDYLFDFGTELYGTFHLSISVKHHGRSTEPQVRNVLVSFGESRPEAEGWPVSEGDQTEHWKLEGHAHQFWNSTERAFRFVRVHGHDFHGEVMIHQIFATATFAFKERVGDLLECSDRRFQQAYQASVYTARLCTRPDCYWNGPKQDRAASYANARVTQLTTDAIFHDPTPAALMLAALPTDSWANGNPTCSFDAIAMFRQALLAHGTSVAGANFIFDRIEKLARWIFATQIDDDGLIVRNDGIEYSQKTGFLDWSSMPVGGRFEELSCLQFKWLESLHNISQMAHWLGKDKSAKDHAIRAAELSAILFARFFHTRTGFVHTRNQTEKCWEVAAFLQHEQSTFSNGKPLGPSVATRHSSALAVWAGLTGKTDVQRTVLRTLDSEKLAPVITAHFAFYEQMARGRCGDVKGALINMRDYIHGQIKANDSATIWESYDPEVTDFRRWNLRDQMKSLCHGCGSGIVPLAQRFLFGLEPTAPGFSEIALHPAAPVHWSFEATVPTPHGLIRITKAGKKRALTEYELPPGIVPTGALPDSARITVKRS